MRFLVVDDNQDILDLLMSMLSEAGHAVTQAPSAAAAESLLKSETFDGVFCDIFMTPMSGIELLKSLNRQNIKVPGFIFITGSDDSEIIEHANKLNRVDVVSKPFTTDSLLAAWKMSRERKSDPILDLMEVMRQASGISLGADKRLLVENRLKRRARELNFISMETYYDYFLQNRVSEIQELVSYLTTHHTFFFREPEHFAYLEDSVFPEALKSPAVNLRIWSAAGSTGEEAYSIAATWLAFLKKNKVDERNAPKLEVIGTDIDHNSVERAKRGIYKRSMIKNISDDRAKAMFDFGEGELSGFVRVKDSIHKLCSFKEYNLQSRLKIDGPFHCIFLRNVMIYFSPDAVEAIISRLTPALRDAGVLILGHSESFNAQKLGYSSQGQSVFKRSPADNIGSKSPKELAGADAQTISTHRPITKVFIIDDSLTVRSILKKIFSKEFGFFVCGEADSGLNAYNQIVACSPDVVTLDIHMPDLDGIGYLKSVQNKPHPAIVMISSVSSGDAISAMKCFDLGAVDYIEKPGADFSTKAHSMRDIVHAASKTTRKIQKSSKDFPNVNETSQTETLTKYVLSKHDLICIGSSTGGVEALRVLLTQLPAHSPPVLIVQHIPAVFSRAMAERLNTLCEIEVKEAAHGEAILPGHAYIAPGGMQMSLTSHGGNFKIRLTSDEPVNRHRPSVDYLFDSVAKIASDRTISAAILTGMGGDGAKGLLAIRKMGGHTIAQDEDSCVVFGMPKVAIEIGAALEIVPLPSIPYHLFRGLKRRTAA